MNKYTHVAFLLGINVGGHRKVPMAELKKVMEENNFSNVKTLLASGNVLFSTDKKDIAEITQVVQHVLTQKFGFEIQVIVRTVEHLQKIVNENVFKNISVTKDTRLYVTFIQESATSEKLKQLVSPIKEFNILQKSSQEIYSVLTLTPESRTVDGMKVLTQTFGKAITTRNWNTIQRIAALL